MLKMILLQLIILLLPARKNHIKNITMNNKRVSVESKVGTKTRMFSNSSAITWNLKRRFK